MATTTFRSEDEPITAAHSESGTTCSPCAASRFQRQAPADDSARRQWPVAAARAQCASSCKRRRRLLASAAESGRRHFSGGQWLLDNYHLIQEQIATARRQLPRQHGKRLPLLGDGPRRGCREFTIWPSSSSAISTADSIGSDCTSSSAPIRASRPLTLAELWADGEHAASGIDRKPLPRRHCGSSGAENTLPLRPAADEPEPALDTVRYATAL